MSLPDDLPITHVHVDGTLHRLDSLTPEQARSMITRLVKEHPMEYPPAPRERPPLHDSTFEYLKPTDTQMHDMEEARSAAATYADTLEALLPPGADKTYALRKLREVAMWANVAITRDDSGAPRP
ncbi:MAG TPA: hypothetical protein VGJ79_00655 [Candidatus Dormibacteraeota bacterium]|jgi:hypothetical protein